MSKLKNLFYLFFPISLGSFIGIVVNPANYSVLNKPLLSPPGWVFPVVWSIIYLLMGLSYYLYKKKDNSDLKTDILYYLQLFVNILWTVIFFSLKLRLLAIIWIILLLILVIFLLIKFYSKIRISAFLNVPYLLWTMFATYLTIAIYFLT